MNDNQAYFENSFRQIRFDDSPDPNHRDQLEQQLFAAYTKQTHKAAIRNLVANSKIAKLAIAAVLVLAVALSVIPMLERSATPAYAIEQTIEALNDVMTAHIVGKDWNGNHIEFWCSINPNTGLSDHIYAETAEFNIASAPHGSCVWDKQGNVMRLTNRVLATNAMRFQHIFEDLAEGLDEESSISISKQKDADSEREFIVIKALTKSQEFEIFVDPDTKLPTSLHFYRADNTEQVLKTAEHINYNEALPEGVFDFEVPESCFENHTPLSDPNNGVKVAGLSQEEASMKTAAEYWNAMIKSDWEYVGRLRPLYSAEHWKSRHSKNPPVELVDIGQPYVERGCSGLLVPCIVKFTNGKVLQVRLVVQYRENDGDPFCVIPATWGKNIEIK